MPPKVLHETTPRMNITTETEKTPVAEQWADGQGRDIRDPVLVGFLNEECEGFDANSGTNYADFLAMMLADESVCKTYFVLSDMATSFSTSCFRNIRLISGVHYKSDAEFRGLCEAAVKRVKRMRADQSIRRKMAEKAKRTKAAQLVAENKSILTFVTRKIQPKKPDLNDGFW